MRKRITALMMTAALACGSLIACGSEEAAVESETQAETETEVAEDAATQEGETIYGEVTAVSDSGFTITVGTLNGDELTLGDESKDVAVSDTTTYSIKMGGGQGQPGKDTTDAEMPEGEAPADVEEGEQPQGEAPTGEAPTGEAPDGEAPSDMGGGQSEVTLESITVGTQVAVTYDADGNVESVQILNAEPAGEKPEEGTEETESTEDSEESEEVETTEE